MSCSSRSNFRLAGVERAVRRSSASTIELDGRSHRAEVRAVPSRRPGDDEGREGDDRTPEAAAAGGGDLEADTTWVARGATRCAAAAAFSRAIAACGSASATR